MKVKHDPLAPHPRRKKTNETPDETEQRLDADLRILMNDERYQKNDRDFRHFVQRQFRRVYDDPTGAQPEGLVIGRPKVFVDNLEPFDRASEQRLRREGSMPMGAKPRQTVTRKSALAGDKGRPQAVRASQLGEANKGSEKLNVNNVPATDNEPDVIPYWERAIGELGPRDRTRSTPFPGIRDVRNEDALQRYQDYLDELKQREGDASDARALSWLFVQSASIAGHDEAVRAHEHYLEGSGEPLIVDSNIVRDYTPVEDAQDVTLGYLKEWFEGKRADSRFGRPWLDLADDERITIGDESFDPDRVGKLVHWETTFEGPSSERDPEWWTNARMTFNSGTLESFGQVNLERHGDRIEISGFVKLRVTDRYDFEKDHILKSRVLADHGGAKSFDISTTLWVRPISGWIDVSGSPVPTVHLTYDD